MTIDKAKVIKEWEELYSMVPPLLADGEKTINMVALELGIDPRTARKYIEQWILDGKIVHVGKRRTGNGPDADAYKIVENK